MTNLITRRTNSARLATVALLILFVSGVLGCERTPEDLEDYRDTQGGQQQIARWVQDPGESMEVRQRGMQILVEDGQFHKLEDVLNGIDDDAERAQIAAAALPTAQQMWEVQDFPQITDELLEQGGTIRPDGLKAIHGVNALYYLSPHMEGEAQEAAQEILRNWISADQEVRTQWGAVRIPFIVPVAGDGAMEEVENWIVDAREPNRLAASLRAQAPDDDALFSLDRAIGERAKQEHPDVSDEVVLAIQDAETKGILPYLETAVTDPDSSGNLFQISIETLFEVAPEEARDIALQTVEEIPGTYRWIAVQKLVDQFGLEIIPDVATALPEDEEFYDNDGLRGRPNSNCRNVAAAIEEGDFDEDPQLIADLLASDHWPARVFGLRCAQQLDIQELRDEIQALQSDRTPIAGWRGGKTIGELAQDVDEAMDEAEAE